jgi:hypothetical protein
MTAAGARTTDPFSGPPVARTTGLNVSALIDPARSLRHRQLADSTGRRCFARDKSDMGQEQTHAPRGRRKGARPDLGNAAQRHKHKKERPPRAAVFPKSDQGFGSGGRERSAVLLRPAISKEAEADEASDQQCPGGGQRGRRQRDIVEIREAGIVCSGAYQVSAHSR